MMMEPNAAVKIPAVNAVEGFDPAALTRQIVNEDGSSSIYLDVKFRMLWFRLRYPTGKLDTEIIDLNERFAVVCCKVYADKSDAAEQYIAKSIAQRFISQEKFGDRYLEIAETAAVGRALAAAGFGTQFCSPADLPNDISDAPIDGSLLSGDEEINGSARSTVVHEIVASVPFAAAQPVMSRNTYHERQSELLTQHESNVNCADNNHHSIVKQNQDPAEQAGAIPKMTLEKAENVKVDFGKYKGFTLGQIAMCNPLDLKWYVEHYAGPNKDVKDGARALIEAAQHAAG